jgi:hypothetical protein
MDVLVSRRQRENKTITAMVTMYCKRHHHSSETTVCSDCQLLLDYALKRLRSCPYGEQKPSCGNCKIHCYKKSMRDMVQSVMCYAGPKMIYAHPILALRHLFDGRRKRADDQRPPHV